MSPSRRSNASRAGRSSATKKTGGAKRRIVVVLALLLGAVALRPLLAFDGAEPDVEPIVPVSRFADDTLDAEPDWSPDPQARDPFAVLVSPSTIAPPPGLGDDDLDGDGIPDDELLDDALLDEEGLLDDDALDALADEIADDAP